MVEDYARRCAWPVRVVEVQARPNVPPEKLRDEEAALLLKAVPEGALVIALDEHGKDLASRDFADHLARWRDAGTRDVALLIGGADGHGAAVLERATLTVAFGRMTWPHLLVRVMAAEQLYRASTILAGHPYHRD